MDLKKQIQANKVDMYYKSQLEDILKIPKEKEEKWAELNEVISSYELGRFMYFHQTSIKDWKYYPFFLELFNIKFDNNDVPIFDGNFRYQDLNAKALWTFVLLNKLGIWFPGAEVSYETSKEITDKCGTYIYDIFININGVKILVDIYENVIYNGFLKGSLARVLGYGYFKINLVFLTKVSEIHPALKNSLEIKRCYGKIHNGLLSQLLLKDSKIRKDWVIKNIKHRIAREVVHTENIIDKIDDENREEYQKNKEYIKNMTHNDPRIEKFINMREEMLENDNALIISFRSFCDLFNAEPSEINKLRIENIILKNHRILKYEEKFLNWKCLQKLFGDIDFIDETPLLRKYFRFVGETYEELVNFHNGYKSYFQANEEDHNNCGV